MKHLDLFSGIGGAALAVDTVWPGSEHTFVEIDKYCQSLLKLRFPNSQIHGDIRTFRSHPDPDCDRRADGQTEINTTEGGEQTLNDLEERDRTLTTNTESYRRDRRLSESLLKGEPDRSTELRANVYGPVDILTGGFPCQPFSQAGRRKGTDDDRYIWPEMLRVIREFKPRWVIGENVGGFVTWSDGLVLRQVFADLESEGYEVQAFVIPAVAVNAPHRRDRVWIVAHHDSVTSGERRNDGSNNRKKRHIQNDKGITPKNKSERNGRERRTGEIGADASDAERKGWTGSSDKNKGRLGLSDRYGSNQGRNWRENWVEVATKFCRMDDGLPAELDGLKLSKSRHRAERLKGLGNAWVPAVAIEIMKKIKEIDL